MWSWFRWREWWQIIAFGGVHEREKRRIVELTFEPGVSAAQVAQAHGVNANQMFKWLCAFERGELVKAGSAVMLPVVVPAPCETRDNLQEPVQEQPAPTGAIHIEFPGREVIRTRSPS
jgi:transposase